MALTITPEPGVKDFSLGNRRAKVRRLAYDNSYSTGGEALTPKDLGFTQIDAVIVTGPARKADGTNAVIASYDHANQKLMAFWSAASGAAPSQVANTTDLSTYSVRVLAIGV